MFHGLEDYEEVTAALAKVVWGDPSMELRIDALQKLSRFKTPNAIPVIREVIALSDPLEQRVCIEAVRQWIHLQPDEEGLALVKELAASHPLPMIRLVAVNGLESYSRKKFPVLEVALERVLQDPEESVPLSAVSLAQRLQKQPMEKVQALKVLEAGVGNKFPKVQQSAAKAISAGN